MTKEQADKQIEAIRKITERAIAEGPEACRRLLIDAGIILDESEKQYGLYQLCPKCDGEGQLPCTNITSMYRTCPVCNGAKLLIRPEIK